MGATRRLSPALATLRLLPRASRRLTIGVAVLVVVSALLPAAFALASGALVGSIGGAVDDGWASPAGRRLVASIGALVALFVLRQLSAPALEALAESLGRRVEGRLRTRVMAATLGPPGVAHLEDPDVADLVAGAQSVGTGQVTVRDAVIGMALVSANSAAGVLAAAVLVGFRWWLAAGLLGVYVAMTWVRAGQLRRTVGALRGHARRFRRSSYFRDLALTPDAAKEVRVFGLASWVGDRFVEEWDRAMAGFSRDRPKGRWLPPTSALVLGVTLGVVYALLGRAAARGEISLGELTTFAGAATGVAALSAVGMHNLNITYGAAAVPAALDLEATVAQPRFALGGSRSAAGLPASGIRFEGVAFGYPGRSDPVFRALDLDIPSGRSLAIRRL